MPDAVAVDAPVAEPIARLPDVHRWRLTGSVPIPDRVVLTGTHAKRLSDLDRRQLADAVPDADTDPESRPVPIAVPDQRERSDAAMSTDGLADAADEPLGGLTR